MLCSARSIAVTHFAKVHPMKNLLLCCLILALAISASVVTAQDQAQDATAFLEALKLAPEHAYLKKHVGKWTLEIKTYFEDPSKPTTSKGSATFKTLMNGRYLQQSLKGEFFGMPFEGRGLTGFDKAKKKFVSTWIDSFETGISVMEGSCDEKTKTMTEIAVDVMPNSEMRMKNVVKEIDENTLVSSMYLVKPDETETLGMQITYRRAK